MNNNDSSKISLLLGTIIIFGIIVLVNNNNIYARQAIWRDFDNMKDFVSAIRNREINDDSINWEKFQTSDVYQDENKDTRDCIKLAHKVGNNLGDYEIVHCFRDVNYFKNNYSEDKLETNTSLNVPEVPETNASQNVVPRSIDIDVTVRKEPLIRGEKIE